MEVRRDSVLPLPQQHRRAGSSRDQATMRLDVGIEIVQDCGDNVCWYRARKSNSQGTVLIRPRRATKELVAQTTLGSRPDAVSTIRSIATANSSTSTSNA